MEWFESVQFFMYWCHVWPNTLVWYFHVFKNRRHSRIFFFEGIRDTNVEDHCAKLHPFVHFVQKLVTSKFSFIFFLFARTIAGTHIISFLQGYRSDVNNDVFLTLHQVYLALGHFFFFLQQVLNEDASQTRTHDNNTQQTWKQCWITGNIHLHLVSKDHCTVHHF